MHLEIFVPKVKKTELRLHKWLYQFMRRAEAIPMNPRAWDMVLTRDPELRKRFASKEYWENIVYGYSIYPADGCFVSGRSAAKCTELKRHFGPPESYRHSICVESIAVVKFIITNYLNFEFDLEQLALVQTLERQRDYDTSPRVTGYALSPAFASFEGRPRFDNQEYFKLRCTALHYQFTADHIFHGIRTLVLPKETEVWAHRWYSVVMRNLTSKSMPPHGRRAPTAQLEERELRFNGEKGSVICVSDYDRDPPGSTLGEFSAPRMRPAPGA